MVAQQFFWDLPDGKEGRAHVGLSKANLVEAQTCAKLVQWFQICGVPSEAISVITPYKGQKLTIIRELEKIGALSKTRRFYPHQVRHGNKNKFVPQPQSNQVVVSTVDRSVPP